MTADVKTQSRSLISSTSVEGTAVFNRAGEKLGSIDSLMIDKRKGSVAYAVMSFGGFLGMGEQRHPMPWQSLTYDETKDGYVVSLSKEELQSAPSLKADEFAQLGDRKYDESIDTHYKVTPYWL